MAYGLTTDEYGLTLPRNFINLYFPATNKSVLLYVTKRRNPYWSLLNFGPLPTTTSTSFSLYASGVGGSSGTGSASAAAAGQIPASAWTKGLQFNNPSTFFFSGTFPYGTGDIWYTQVKDTIFEVYQKVTPGWLRVEIEAPANQNQQALQQSVAGGVDQDFGWKRGEFYAVHLPWLHYGYGYGNDSNFPVYTRTIFRYAEQQVELVTNPQLSFDILQGIIPSHLVEMPVVNSPGAVSQALQQTWGFDGVPVLPFRTPREDFVTAIAGALSKRTGGA